VIAGIQESAPLDWWRPRPRTVTATAVPVKTASVTGNRLAFRALVVFTVILLLSPQSWVPLLGSLRIAFVAAAVAIGAVLLERMSRAREARPAFVELGVAFALIAWSMLTIPLSYWPAGSAEVMSDQYLKSLAFFWLIGAVAVTTSRITVFAWTLVLCSIPLAATGLMHYLAGGTLSTGVDGFRRIVGYNAGAALAANPNDLALMLNLIIPIAGAVAANARGWARMLAIGALLLSAAAVIVTFSRAGFLTLATTIVAFVLLLARNGSLAAAGGVFAVALIAVPLLPSGYLARLETITDHKADETGSATGRWRDLQVAAGFIGRHPLVGAGVGQDVLAMNAERGDEWRSVHNVYLQYGVDLGVPGLLLFVWLHAACLRRASRVRVRAAQLAAMRPLSRLAAGVQISLIAFGVAGLFHPIAYQFYFFCIAGLAVAVGHAWRLESGLRRPSTSLGTSQPRPTFARVA
jgi:O-antigen ligase